MYLSCASVGAIMEWSEDIGKIFMRQLIAILFAWLFEAVLPTITYQLSALRNTHSFEYCSHCWHRSRAGVLPLSVPSLQSMSDWTALSTIIRLFVTNNNRQRDSRSEDSQKEEKYHWLQGIEYVRHTPGTEGQVIQCSVSGFCIYKWLAAVEWLHIWRAILR